MQDGNRSSEKHRLDVETKGIPPLTVIGFPGERAQAAMTYYTQEMLAKGYLLGAAVFTCFAYNDEIIDQFLTDSDDVFARIKMHTDAGTISEQLKSDISYGGFKRLT